MVSRIDMVEADPTRFTADVAVDRGRVLVQWTDRRGDCMTFELTPSQAVQLSLLLATAARETGA